MSYTVGCLADRQLAPQRHGFAAVNRGQSCAVRIALANFALRQAETKESSA
jgi:hypothetical protein